MNDKCASGTGATIDKCFLKVERAAGAWSTTLHFDDSKLHHVAAKCGVFAETDIVNLIKSGIPANEVLCSLADAIVLQNLSRADARQHAEAQGAAARRPEHVPAVPPGVLAPAHPADVGRARLRRTRRTSRSRSSIFVPENAQYYAALGAVLYGLHEAATSARFTGIDGARASTSPTAARRASARRAGPPLVEDERRARRLHASSTRSRSSSRRRSSRAQVVRARHRSRRRLDVAQGRARRLRERQDPRARPTSSRRATRSRTRRSSSRSSSDYVDRPGRDARGHGLRRDRLRGRRARGVRARRREHRRDRRAHDERGALLRRRRRHLRHRRAGHQGPVHEERRHRELPPVELLLGRQRHAAAGDGRLSSACRSPSSPTSRSRPSSRRSSATAAPSSSTPIA